MQVPRARMRAKTFHQWTKIVCSSTAVQYIPGVSVKSLLKAIRSELVALSLPHPDPVHTMGCAILQQGRISLHSEHAHFQQKIISDVVICCGNSNFVRKDT